MKNLTSYCDTRGTLSMAKTNSSTYAKLPHRESNQNPWKEERNIVQKQNKKHHHRP